MGSPRPELPGPEKVPADAAEPDRFASMTTTEGRTDGSLADPSAAGSAADGSTPAPEARTGNEDHHA